MLQKYLNYYIVKIVQSFWSGNQKEFTNSHGWFNYKYNWISWILSCHQLVKYHKEVELFTDQFGYEILIKKLQLPYTKVHVVLDELNQYHKDLWAIAKIKTFQMQKEPFLHVDGDVFVWESLTEKFKDSNLVTQNLEVTTDYYRQGWKALYPSLTFLPEAMNDFHNNKSNLACNMGIIGGTNLEFFKDFTQKSIEFVDKNELNWEELKDLNFNVFFEQVLFYELSKQRAEKIDFRFLEIPKDNEYRGFGDFHKVPDRSFLHLLGVYKRHHSMCKAMEVYTMKYYPENYSKLTTLVNEHNKNNTEIDNLTSGKVGELLMNYEQELKNSNQNIDNYLLKRDLYNEGMPLKFDAFIKNGVEFKIVLNGDFERKTHSENNSTIDYLEISELNSINEIYALDQIDKIMLQELENPIAYSDFILRCKEYFEGNEDEKQTTFLKLINNRLRKYIVLKIISVITAT